MDGHRMDQITRALTKGVTRRGAVKGIAVALGLSAAGVAHAPTAAARPWCACTYACGAGGSVEFCAHHCRPRLPGRQGSTSCASPRQPATLPRSKPATHHSLSKTETRQRLRGSELPSRRTQPARSARPRVRLGAATLYVHRTTARHAPVLARPT